MSSVTFHTAFWQKSSEDMKRVSLHFMPIPPVLRRCLEIRTETLQSAVAWFTCAATNQRQCTISTVLCHRYGVFSLNLRVLHKFKFLEISTEISRIFVSMVRFFFWKIQQSPDFLAAFPGNFRTISPRFEIFDFLVKIETY